MYDVFAKIEHTEHRKTLKEKPRSLKRHADGNSLERYLTVSLLAEVSHDEAKMRERRETSAGFRRVV